MPRTTTTFAVWVSSPSDTFREREVVKRVVDELNYSPIARELGLVLQVKLWELTPPTGSDRPQELANSVPQEIADNDIFIGILKNRLGTVLPSEFGNRTGTEFEFEAALDSYRARGTPRILFYFGSSPATISDDASLAQLRAAGAYKAKLSESGLVATFANEREFALAVRRDVTRFLADWSASTRTTTPTEAPTIFISYSRQQSEFVSALAEGLAGAGLRAWYDTADIQGGVDWLEAIATAIERSSAVVLLVSKSSLASQWVRREVEFAVQKSKPVLPVSNEDCQWPSWANLLFGGTQRLVLYDQRNTQQIERIVEASRRLGTSMRTST